MLGAFRHVGGYLCATAMVGLNGGLARAAACGGELGPLAATSGMVSISLHPSHWDGALAMMLRVPLSLTGHGAWQMAEALGRGKERAEVTCSPQWPAPKPRPGSNRL